VDPEPEFGWEWGTLAEKVNKKKEKRRIMDWRWQLIK